MRRKLTLAIAGMVLLVLGASALFAQTKSLTLSNDFIQKYKDRATITAKFFVDACSAIHPASEDADLHIAGRSPDDIGLPMVAEIMNAKTVSATVKSVRQQAGSGNSVKVSGAWRLWFEHPGDDQVQFANVSVAGDGNPDHVFEIHPVNVFQNDSVTSTIKLISGYTPKTAKAAFKHYENTPCHLIKNNNTTTIETNTRTRNYVKFKMQITGNQKVVSDGRIVPADVLDLNDNPLVDDIRMIFIKNTSAERKVKDLGEGKSLTVLGIPRVNLDEIDKRITKSSSNPALLDLPLPYEIIIVGVYQ